MRLREYLRNDLVLLGLEAANAPQAIRSVADRIAETGLIRDADGLAERLLARESVHSTCMGDGVAVPHATVPELDDAVIGIAVARDPIPFGEDESVRIMFLLVSPPDRSAAHIKLLARIARLVRHPGFIDRLAAAGTTAEVLDEVERVDAQHV